MNLIWNINVCHHITTVCNYIDVIIYSELPNKHIYTYTQMDIHGYIHNT